MRINKWTAFAIGILLISGMGFVIGAPTMQGNPFRIMNASSGKLVAWIDREGNFNASGGIDIDLAKFNGTGTLGGGNVSNLANSSLISTFLLSWTKIGDKPDDCAAGSYVSGINGETLDCTADDDTPDSDAEVPDAITVDGGTIALSTNTYSGSLLPGQNITVCGDNEILKVDTDTWACEADATGVGDATAPAAYFNVTGDTLTGNATVGTGMGFNTTTAAAITYDGNGGWTITLT